MGRLIRIGTAGWSIPRQHAGLFEGEGSALERYGRVLGCAEINSTFYRSHRASTYARWVDSVPEGFLFSVKAPKTITHECGFLPARELMQGFVEEMRQLGSKLGPMLFQLPPKQGFEERVARAFFGMVREEYGAGAVVLEPRHASWFTADADAVLKEFCVARAAADPERVEGAMRPGGDASVVYYRLHGSPRMYYSSYGSEWMERLAAEMALAARDAEVWCVFDNTASGAALGDALRLIGMCEAEG